MTLKDPFTVFFVVSCVLNSLVDEFWVSSSPSSSPLCFWICDLALNSPVLVQDS